MRKATVGKTPYGWVWLHVCRGVNEPGGYVQQISRGFSKQQHAFIAAWWHVKACRGKRQYPEIKERT